MPEAAAQKGWLARLFEFILRLLGLAERTPAPEPEPQPEPPPRPEPEPSPARYFVAIDPGHGGSDSGAVNQTVGVSEKNIALAISGLLREAFTRKSHRVLMTRETDVFVALDQRAHLANQAGTQVFISIHCNSAENSAAEGIETFHHPTSSGGQILAQRVHQSLIRAFPSHRDRGVKSANFVVLRESQMPACLVETEFISNNSQARFLMDPDNQNKIAQALMEGIESYLA